MTPRPEVTVYVRNQSSRKGAQPRRIVVHTTEGHDRPGLADLHNLGAWFDNPSAQASSHVANDAEANDARYVADERKAWTQSNANPDSLSIEQIGFARFDAEDWSKREDQLRNTAQWIAYWSKKYGIPIVNSTSHGVCEHSQLGRFGGGHHDCGPYYPLDRVLRWARLYAGVTEMGRKERIWRRSLRIVRAKAARRGWKLPWRVRGRKLKKLIAREEARRAAS